jgi:hypothetical protein
MTYAVLQSTLDIPSIDQLKRAFRSVRRLTDMDAHILAADAYGTLVKGFSLAEANTLKTALDGEGVPTEVVAQRDLPELPPTKFVNRIDVTESALQVYDPLGRSFPIEWRHLLLVAAGSVRLTEFNRKRNVRFVTQYRSNGTSYQTTEVDYRTREEMNWRPLLEIVLTRSVLRYTVRIGSATLVYLGDRATRVPADNFATAVGDLLARAPHAAINRGAYYLRERSPDPFQYPSRNAFHEEIIWLLWRLQQAGKLA